MSSDVGIVFTGYFHEQVRHHIWQYVSTVYHNLIQSATLMRIQNTSNLKGAFLYEMSPLLEKLQIEDRFHIEKQ